MLQVADPPRDDLVVGGNLDFEMGAVHSGNIIYGGEYEMSTVVQAGMGVHTITKDPTRFDFAAAKSHYEHVSLYLATRAPTGTYTTSPGSIVFTGTNDPDFEVFNVESCADLGPGNAVVFEDIEPTATIIVDIEGTVCDLMNINLGSPDVTKTIWNYYHATELHVSGISVEGAVLAPSAFIQSSSGVIQGQVIADSWEGGLQQQSNTFDGCIPTDADDHLQPIPATLAAPTTTNATVVTTLETATTNETATADEAATTLVDPKKVSVSVNSTMVVSKQAPTANATIAPKQAPATADTITDTTIATVKQDSPATLTPKQTSTSTATSTDTPVTADHTVVVSKKKPATTVHPFIFSKGVEKTF